MQLIHAMICFGKKEYYSFIELFVKNETKLVNIGASDEQREVIVEIAIFCSSKCLMFDYTRDLILKNYGVNYNSLFIKSHLEKIGKC